MRHAAYDVGYAGRDEKDEERSHIDASHHACDFVLLAGNIHIGQSNHEIVQN